MNIIVTNNKINMPIIITVEIAPVRPSSKVVTKDLGISATIPEKIINEIKILKMSERQGRLIDHDDAYSMEKKKIQGYF